jgi:hypothetical protein
MRMRDWLIGTGGALIGLALIPMPAGTQTQVQRIRGTIVNLDGRLLTVATREGPQVRTSSTKNILSAPLRRAICRPSLQARSLASLPYRQGMEC